MTTASAEIPRAHETNPFNLLIELTTKFLGNQEGLVKSLQEKLSRVISMDDQNQLIDIASKTGDVLKTGKVKVGEKTFDLAGMAKYMEYIPDLKIPMPMKGGVSINTADLKKLVQFWAESRKKNPGSTAEARNEEMVIDGRVVE
jgi:hypothetical protein